MTKLLLPILAVLLFTTIAEARLQTVGKGDTLTIDPTGFPPEMQKAYDLMRVKCVKCHTMERSVIAIQTGVAPITGGLFDRTATKAYGIKMLRKPDSDMTKEDVKTVIPLLNFLLDEAAR